MNKHLPNTAGLSNDRQLLRSLLTEGDSVLNEQPEAVINHQAPYRSGIGQVPKPVVGGPGHA